MSLRETLNLLPRTRTACLAISTTVKEMARGTQLTRGLSKAAETQSGSPFWRCRESLISLSHSPPPCQVPLASYGRPGLGRSQDALRGRIPQWWLNPRSTDTSLWLQSTMSRPCHITSKYLEEAIPRAGEKAEQGTTPSLLVDVICECHPHFLII